MDWILENERFSLYLLAGYLIVLSVAWLLMVINISLWGKKWLVSQTPPPDKGPLLSVCVPARNEAENIGQCVEAVLKSDWPNLELIVVDDRSDDDTARRAQEAAQGDPRFRLIEGSEPLVGWAGKPWTCARAARESKGHWLLFIDADVQLHSGAATAAITTAEQRSLDVLSFFGHWTLVGFWERCLIPAVGWFIRGAVNFDEVNSPSKEVAFANGQFILMRRSAYVELAGHEVVRDEVLEDVRLAQAFKRVGYRTEMRPAPWSFSVRLYRSLGEIINGYTKNLYEGMERNPIVGFSAILFISFGSVFPFVGALMGGVLLLMGISFIPLWAVLWLVIICFLQLLFRYRIELYDGHSGIFALTHPFANVLLVFILIRSTLGVRVQWKGRTFVDGKASSKVGSSSRSGSGSS